jgi:hypothetical protein
MNKKIIPIILGMFLLVSLVSASSSLPSIGTGFKQGQNVTLIQGCANSTYSNTTSVYVDGTQTFYLNSEITMSEVSNDNYQYNFSQTNFLGTYIVIGHCDLDGIDTQWSYTFEVTPSGQSGTENIIFLLIILVGLYTLTLLFFLKRDVDLAPFTALSGMALGTFGLYMIQNGIIIYRDWFSNYFSYLTMGVGFGLGLWAIIAWIEDSM